MDAQRNRREVRYYEILWDTVVALSSPTDESEGGRESLRDPTGYGSLMSLTLQDRMGLAHSACGDHADLHAVARRAAAGRRPGRLDRRPPGGGVDRRHREGVSWHGEGGAQSAHDDDYEFAQAERYGM